MGKKRRRHTAKKWVWVPWDALRKGMGRAAVRAFPLLLTVALAAALFLGVREALYADPHLSIQQIVVEPSDVLSASRRKELEESLLGKNILRVDLRQIARRLEENPEIQYARVVRHLPALLKIQIETRRPLAFVRYSPRGDFGLVSEDGMILDVLKERHLSLFLIEAYDTGSKDPRAGERIGSAGFSEAVKFVRAFWKHPLARRETITKIDLDHLGNVTATLGGGPPIRLGRRPSHRLPALEKFLALLKGQDRSRIEYVDLQFDQVIVKRKG